MHLKIIPFVLIYSFFLAHAYSQQALKGRILSGTGEPLPAVSISVKEIKSRTLSDDQGNFTLENVRAGHTISITSIGYDPIVRTVGESDFSGLLTIKLKRSSFQLEEVSINTGYQQLPRERSTGSFTHVSKDLFSQQLGTDILTRLSAVTAGITTDRGTTGTGRIMVRGLSSIRGPKDPLIVVDNFPYSGDLQNLNPNDVESITVLKDAAAASIWGARAGNGVIVITMQKGKFNQPVSVNFNSSVRMGLKPDLDYIKQMSASDFIGVEELLYSKNYYRSQINSSARPVLSPVIELLSARDNGSVSRDEAERQLQALKGVNVRDEFSRYLYRTSYNQQYSLSLNGGSEKFGWISSFGYDNNISNLDALYQRKNLRLNGSYKLTKNLNISTKVLYTQSKGRSGRPGYGDIAPKGSGGLYPYARFADDLGQPVALPMLYRQSYILNTGEGKLLDWQYYPLEDYKHSFNRNNINDVLINIGLNYRLMAGLNLDLKYQLESQHTKTETLYDEDSFYARNTINLYTVLDGSGTIKHNVPPGGIQDYSHQNLLSDNIRAQIAYAVQSGNSDLSVIAGGEVREAVTEGSQDRMYGFDSHNYTFGNVDYNTRFPTSINGSLAYIQNNRDITRRNNRFVSVFANGAYTFARKYTLSLSGRRDASNLFGLRTNDQWNPFWSAGAAWILSGEEFYHLTALPHLKIRLSYGSSGNIDPSMVAVTTLAYLSEPSPYTNLRYSRFSNYYNPELRWETSKMLNAGVDFSFRDNMLSGSIEYYRKNGTNLFGTAPLDYTAGTGATIVKNVASMTGKGIDIQLKSQNLSGKTGWTTTLNLNHYKDEIKDYYLSSYQASRFISTDATFPITEMKGYPVYSVLAYRWGGLDPENGDPIGYVNGEKSKAYSTITGSDTKVTDLKFFGSAVPTTFGSLINSFSYRNIRLDFSISYKLGYYMRRSSINYSSLFSNWQGHSDYEKRWQQPGDEQWTNVPSLIYPTTTARNSFYSGSEVLVEKADHIRLQYINLDWNISSKQSVRSALKTLHLYLNADNIGILWRENKQGIDPDYNYGTNPLPPARIYSIGLRAGF